MSKRTLFIRKGLISKVSSGEPYPIAHYVTCDKFSNVHRHYLTAISKVMEPRFFEEVVGMGVVPEITTLIVGMGMENGYGMGTLKMGMGMGTGLDIGITGPIPVPASYSNFFVG